jgi:hypothetical protein
MAKTVIEGLTAEETELILREREELARARTWFSFTAILNIVLFYCLAFSIVGFEIGITLVWAALSGVAVGLLIAFTICSWAIFATIDDAQQLKDRQFFIGMWVKVAIAISALALVFMAIKTLFRL